MCSISDILMTRTNLQIKDHMLKQAALDVLIGRNLAFQQDYLDKIALQRFTKEYS